MVSFVRDLPYQYRTNIVEHFRTSSYFQIMRCVQVIDDRGFTVLARALSTIRTGPESRSSGLPR